MEKKRFLKDKIAGNFMLALVIFAGLIIFFIIFGLFQKSRPILSIKPLEGLLLSGDWSPLKGEFGFFPFIIGTIWVTSVALLIAAPLSVLTAIYLSEYAPARVREWAKPFIDLLAGIPSVIFGVWGILVIVPFIKNQIGPFFGISSTGYSVLAGGTVLAIMIFPVIIHISLEVFRSVPQGIREASFVLGATKWQTVKHAVVKKAAPGIIAAIVLGLARAFGETMAVLMVVGNVVKIPSSLLDAAYPLPALIANNYGEMLSIPLYDSALMFAALILLVVVLFFNIISKIIINRVERNM